MNWLYYLLEANFYLLIFWGFYRLSLQQETFYTLNRFYLVTATVISFVLPVLQVSYLQGLFDQEVPLQYVNNSPIVLPETALNTPLNLQKTGIDGLLIFYLSSCLFFFFKLLYSFRYIFFLSRKGVRKVSEGIKIIELEHTKAAFSFLNMLFIDPAIPQKDAVLKHEITHIRQKHSLDILLIEIIQIFNWFSPVHYLLKKEIKLVHEYLADAGSTQNGITKHSYAMFLINHSYPGLSSKLAHQLFNPSNLKMRINMLNKPKSAGWARLKYLLYLPIGTGMIFISSLAYSKTYPTFDLYPDQVSFEILKTAAKPQIPNHKNTINQEKKETQKPFMGKYSGLYRSDQSNLYLEHHVVDGKISVVTKSLFIINGRPTDIIGIGLIDHIEQLSYIKPEAAIKKYGTRAAKGAFEITGKHIELKKIAPPPPIAQQGKDFIVTGNSSKPITFNYAGTKWLRVWKAKSNQSVYSNFNYNNDWDGKTGNTKDFQGKPLPKGTYYYIVSNLSPGEPQKDWSGKIDIQ